jgi:hypothetical protein
MSANTGAPRTLFYIKSSSGDFSDELRVLDLSGSLKFTSSKDFDVKDTYKKVEQAAKEREHDANAWSYQMNRGALSAVLNIHDFSDSGRVVAELNMSILKHYGTWKLSFTQESRFGHQVIDVTPVSLLKKQERFTFGSSSYMWDMTMGGGCGILYKAFDGKYERIGEFVAKSWFKNSCVLMLDTEEVDELVGLATCVAALNRDI